MEVYCWGRAMLFPATSSQTFTGVINSGVLMWAHHTPCAGGRPNQQTAAAAAAAVAAAAVAVAAAAAAVAAVLSPVLL